MALLLKKRGIDRVRPLAGGLDAWLAAGMPVESLEADGLPAEIDGAVFEGSSGGPGGTN